MANQTSNQSAIWQTAKFAFLLKWDDADFIFQEVSGLNAETEIIEYRAGSSKTFSTVKMPGLQKFGNVTLKKGVFKGDKTVWTKFQALTMNTFKRAKITICLLDESGNAAMSWTLENAFLTKISFPSIKSDSDEAAIETMELAHEGIRITN